jgi:hypothetical protein
MAVTIKEYIALYSAGNEVDLTGVNQKAAGAPVDITTQGVGANQVWKK